MEVVDAGGGSVMSWVGAAVGIRWWQGLKKMGALEDLGWRRWCGLRTVAMWWGARERERDAGVIRRR